MYLKKLNYVSVITLSLFLTACGGGGSGGGGGANIPSEPTNPTNPTNPTQPIIVNDLTAFCSIMDNNCGSLNNNTYSGVGTGIWKYINNTDTPIEIGYSISGVNNKFVSKNLVSLELNKNTPTDISGINFNISLPENISPKEASNSNDTTVPDKLKKFEEFLYQQNDIVTKDFISKYKNNNSRNLHQNYSAAVATTQAPPVFRVPNNLNVGATQPFVRLMPDTNTYATTGYTLTNSDMLSDGRKLYIWVETNEFVNTKITPNDTDSIRKHLLNVYDSLLFLNGQSYLNFGIPNLIPETDSEKQPINIMLTNFNYDNRGFGLLGYYYSANEYIGYPNSNEALQVFLDTETIYYGNKTQLDPTSDPNNQSRKDMLDIINSTLSHELSHLMLYTQRTLLRNSYYSSFSNESFAESVEDILFVKSGFSKNFLLDNRVPPFTRNYGTQCTFYNWSCLNPYDRSSVLMAFLLRKYGTQFYLDVTRDSVSRDDYTLFDNAVKKNGGVSMTDELIKFQIIRSGLSGKTVSGFDLPAISTNGFDMISYNSLIPPSYNITNPSSLEGIGASWFKSSTESNPQGKFTLPAHTAFVLVVK